MRTRGLKATLAAGLLLGASAAACAQSDDFFVNLDKSDAPVRPTASAKLEGHSSEALSIDKLLERHAAKPDPSSATIPPADDLVGLASEDWAPDHAIGAKRPAAPIHPLISAKTETMKVDDKSIDLDPDDAVRIPAAPTPSQDPLDVGKPATADAPAPPGLVAPPAHAVADVLPPLDAAIKAALDHEVDAQGPHIRERRKEREAIAFFYASHGFAPLWSKDGVAIAAVEPLLTRLGHASDDALSLPVPPVTLKVEGSVTDLAASEIALTEAVVAYARQATGSRVDPTSISPLIGSRAALADPGSVLDSLADAGADAGNKLQALNPVDPRYAALRDQLAQIHAAHSAAVSDLPIPAGPTLRVGMHDPRVPLIRSRFSLDSAAADAEDLEYDTQVADAVADFQEGQRSATVRRAEPAHPRGLVWRPAVATRRHDRRQHGNVALDAARPRPRPDRGQRAGLHVTVYHDGDAVARNRVVVGKTDTPTPLFSNTMKYLIVNPVWNVPDSIIKKEFLPKSGDDPDYIAAHGFDVSYDHGRLVVKQPSGAKNALGRIKFMFPNDYSVYLHDTPSKSLFAASKRAFSHGCVRVDQPFDFAESVLNDGVPEGGDIVWSKKRLTAMLGDKEHYVYLPKPLPIHIEYFTASVEPETGRLQLHDDVYDYTRKVAAALGQDGD